MMASSVASISPTGGLPETPPDGATGFSGPTGIRAPWMARADSGANLALRPTAAAPPSYPRA